MQDRSFLHAMRVIDLMLFDRLEKHFHYSIDWFEFPYGINCTVTAHKHGKGVEMFKFDERGDNRGEMERLGRYLGLDDEQQAIMESV